MAYPRSFTIHSAFIEQDSAARFVVSSTTTTWILSLFGAFLFITAAIFIAAAGGFFVLLALFPLMLAMRMLLAYPSASGLTFDYTTCEVAFFTKYMLRVPSQIQFSQAFADGLQADISEGGGLFRCRAAVLQMANGARIVMPFRDVVDAENLILRVARLNRYQSAPVVEDAAPVGEDVEDVEDLETAAGGETVEPVEDVHDPAFIERQKARQRAEIRAALAIQLQARIQNWVIWLVLMAVIQFASTPAEVSPWAVMLLLVAGVSLVFKDPAMLIIYATIFGWVAVENVLFAEEILWKGLGLLQAYWGFQLVQEFRRFRQLEQLSAEPDMPRQFARAAGWFPWVSMSLGGLSILATLGGFAFIIVSAALTGGEPDMAFFSLSFTTGIYMAVLGLASGLGAWLSRFPYRFAAIIGTVLSALTLIGTLILSLS